MSYLKNTWQPTKRTNASGVVIDAKKKPKGKTPSNKAANVFCVSALRNSL
jgi:hypothetical protein